MHRVLIGTAGHIDHGKTRLVEALTGTDCDRWDEEKQRGITIDLGFAHLESDELQLGFVDVPGHEKFLDNALAGLGGIRIMLLVVSADEGVKPQTLEHLAICSLLEIEHGIVALTKRDLVDDETLELATLELDEVLSETPFANAPVFPVSSLSGEGVPELLEALRSAATSLDEIDLASAPVRLPIDRSFHLKGLGVVVTGTLASGTIRPGETFELQPGDQTARVRNVQVHGENVEAALPGQRTALQLTGAGLEELPRGTQLVEAGAYLLTTRLAAQIDWLRDAPEPLKGPTPIRFHLFSSEIVGRARPLDPLEIAPGESGAVEIQLSRPVLAIRGDRFILRRPSPPMTLGGGKVLDPTYRRRRGKALQRALKSLRGALAPSLVAWVEEARERGADVTDLAHRVGARPAEIQVELETLAQEQKLIETPAGPGHGKRWLTPRTIRNVSERAAQYLADYFERERLARGVPKAEAIEKILPGGGAELAAVYLRWLAAQGVLTVDGDLIDLPGRQSSMTGEETDLSKRIVAAFDAAGLTPGSPPDIQRSLDAKPQIFQGLMEYLIERKKLVRLPGGLIIAASAIPPLADSLRQTDWESFTVADFKDRFGLTRKWAIPLLEHLDSEGVTRRVGNERQIVRGSEG